MSFGKRPGRRVRVTTDETGTEVTPLLPYGVGIDTHKEFIQVCVLVQKDGQILRFEKEFPTTWNGLQAACLWAKAHAGTKIDALENGNFRYTIESTGTYHVPVLLAWRGKPSVVNPTLAGPTKRKTDVLDARLLAHHSLVGMWPQSFIPRRAAEVLRVLVNMRSEATRNATRALNRINNHLLRFGHTIGRECSMADLMARGLVEDLCTGHVPKMETICPDGIPEAARVFFMDAYKSYDHFCDLRDTYEKRAKKYLKETTWPTRDKEVPGNELLEMLKTIPGCGDISALTWLQVVCDPRRFNNSKQVAAFCGADPSLKVSAGKVTSHVKRKGNARLHHVLKNVAAQLVRRHSEPFGNWGFSLQRRHAKGGWARAINAVSRRLAIAMWQVHLRCEPFSYDKYRFYQVPEVVDATIDEMDLGSRYTPMLKEAGLSRSNEVAKAFMTSLPQRAGIGAGCLNKVKAWLDSHRVEPTNKPRPPMQERLKDFLLSEPLKEGVESSTPTNSPEPSKPASCTKSAVPARPGKSISGLKARSRRMTKRSTESGRT